MSREWGGFQLLVSGFGIFPAEVFLSRSRLPAPGSHSLFYRHRLPFALVLILAALLSVPRSALAYNDFLQDYNHSRMRWITMETPHFRVYYPTALREKAEEVARISEDLYRIYTERYRLSMPERIDLAVNDSDDPNGWASPILGMVSIDIHEFDFSLRGTHSWLRYLLAHELAHVFSIRPALKLPAWIPELRLGYFDYPNEKWQSSGFHVVSSDILPQWFAEGIAQYESSREGTDEWDTHRDMLLRVAVLENDMLTYDEMCVFTGKSINFERTYNHGFSLVTYIAEKYGYDAILALIREAGRFHYQSFKPVIKAVLGISADELYEQWRKSLAAVYTRQLRQVGTQAYGAKVTDKGFSTSCPRWAPDGKSLYFLSNWEADYGFRSLRKYDPAQKDKRKRFKVEVPEVGSAYSLSGDGSKLTYLSSKKRDRDGFPRRDVFLRKLKPGRHWYGLKDPQEKRLTKNMSALYADLSRDGKTLVFVKKDHDYDYLVMQDIESGKTRCLFPNREGKRDTRFSECNIYTPRLEPNGDKIVFSYFDGAARQIGIVDTTGRMFYTFFSSGCDDRDPSWSPDGEHVLFSSDRTGIFNLYKKSVRTGQVLRVTNVSGGAFEGEMSPDGKQIAYINYDRTGFSLYLAPDTVIDAYQDNPLALKPKADSLPPLILSSNPKPYRTMPNKLLFSPMILGQEIIAKDKEANKGVARWFGGGLLSYFDPLNKNSLSALFLLQINEGFDFLGPKYPNFINPGIDKEFGLYWENRSLVPTIRGEFNLRTIHQIDRFWSEDDRDTMQLNYQLSLMDLGAGARYQLTPGQKIHAFGDLFSSQAYLYNVDYFPPYNYLKGWHAGLMWTFLQQGMNTASNIAPQGMYLKLKADRWHNELIREGTFSEAFTIENGAIVARMDEFDFNMVKADFKIGMPSPFYSKHFLGLAASAVGIDRPVHSFFEVGPLLKGYPAFLNRDSLYVSGNKSLQMEVEYYFPICKEINRAYGPLFLDQLYGMGFYEMGGAWNMNFRDLKNIRPDSLLKSVGAELRLECLTYSMYPLSAYLRAAYPLDMTGTFKERTRFQFGLSFTFDDWDLIDIPDYLQRNFRHRQ